MNLTGQLKPMLAFFGIVLFFQVLFCESKISWKAYTPKSVTEPSISFYSGKLVVPANYESPETSPKLNLYIRKMCNNPSPTWDIITLPGGPGADGKNILNNISSMSKSLKSISYCLYTIDHRGVGKSKPKLVEEDDSEDWMYAIEQDVLELAKYLKEFNPNIKLGLIGESYGSMLAHRVLSIDPNMFDVCILDGYATFEYYSIDNDEGLILDCIDNPTCKSKLGSNPEYIRNVPSYLFDENFNDCTEALHKFLKEKYGTLTKSRKKKKFQYYLNPFNNDREGFHRLVVAMIHHAWACPDTKIFKEALKKFDDIRDQKEDSKNSISSDASNIKGSNTEKLNNFVLNYLRLSEMIRIYMEDGRKPDNCFKRKYPIGLVHNCYCWSKSKKEYEEIRRYLYTPDHLESNSSSRESKKEISSIDSNIKGIFQKSSLPTLTDIKSIDHNVPPIKTEKTKVYLIHGRLDLNTPLAPALREFKSIEAPEKRRFIFHNKGHCVAFDNTCRNKIMNEIFNNGSKDETDKCINAFNNEDASDILWEKVDELDLWAKGKDGNDNDLKPLPKEPHD